MAITYATPVVEENALTAKVVYTNDEGKVFERSINVPYVDGVLDEAEWATRLEQHLSAVKHKAAVGVIQFTDPTPPAEANTAPPAGE